jgi:hypothetical protein
MKTIEEISYMSLAQCNEELGAAGSESTFSCVEEAREALIKVTREYQLLGMPVKSYQFATDDSHGDIMARDFLEAIEMLCGMLPEETIFNGGWGWVKNEDGKRHCINC